MSKRSPLRNLMSGKKVIPLIIDQPNLSWVALPRRAKQLGLASSHSQIALSHKLLMISLKDIIFILCDFIVSVTNTTGSQTFIEIIEIYQLPAYLL